MTSIDDTDPFANLLGRAKHLEMVADGGLRDVAAGHEIARAYGIAARELAQDGEPCRVGGALEQERVRIRDLLHGPNGIDR